MFYTKAQRSDLEHFVKKFSLSVVLNNIPVLSTTKTQYYSMYVANCLGGVCSCSVLVTTITLCLSLHDFSFFTVRSKGPELYHPSVKFEDVGGNDETLKVS